MQALKVLVIGMGVLIVIGLALVAYGLVAKTGRDGQGAAGFGEVDLNLPVGCGIAEVISDGGRLILRLEDLAARYRCQSVIVIDMSNGKVIGQVSANKAQ